MSATTEPENTPAQPASLEGHTVPPERMAQILPHVRTLSQAARRIDDELPFQADAADFVKVLETEAR